MKHDDLREIQMTEVWVRHFIPGYTSKEDYWTPWEPVCSYKTREMAEESMKVFQEINPKREYKLV